MATAQVNGSSLTSTPYGSFSEAKNSNGTIRSNGTVSSKVVTSTRTVDPSVGVVGSVVVDNSWADKAVSGGVFAHNHTKPISSLITTELAGLTNNTIHSPGNDGDTIRSINKLETLRTRRFTTSVRLNKYNRFTNTFDAGYPVVAVDSLATDVAATPSRDYPGKLTYLAGGKVPVYGNDTYSNYKRKTN